MLEPDNTPARPGQGRRVLLAKTALDGHWRGLSIVARALRDAGFEVILAGMANDEEIARLAVDEDVDLVGLNIGGRIEVVERIVARLAAVAPGLPVFVGGAIAPWMKKRFEASGIEAFPPGSSLSAIVVAATRLTTAVEAVA
jgi:methylmalonyl-CoA mutase C-terminal domain/subunit